MYLVPCSCSAITGEIGRRACIEICERLHPGEAKMISLAFYAQALITGDRLILGSSVDQLKEEGVICVNGCSMECATKVVKALGVQPQCSIKLLDELPGIRITGRLLDIKPEDVDIALAYIVKRMQV